jgi:hypothetical protein
MPMRAVEDELSWAASSEALATVYRVLDYVARVPDELRDQLPVVEDVDRDRPPVSHRERE